MSLLALHCMLAAGGAWRGVRRALPEREFTAPDLPGHGRAPDWDAGRDFMDQACDLAWAAAPEGAFDLVGHSYGGCLALRLLADRPARIRSLTLLEPVMFAAADPAARTEAAARMAGYRGALAAGDREAAARSFTGMWGDGGAWDDLAAHQRDYITARIHLVQASGPGIADDVHDILPRLPEAPPPVTIAARNDPPPVVASIAEGLARRLPGARIVRIGAGHMIPMEAPEEVARLLERGASLRKTPRPSDRGVMW